MQRLDVVRLGLQRVAKRLERFLVAVQPLQGRASVGRDGGHHRALVFVRFVVLSIGKIDLAKHVFVLFQGLNNLASAKERIALVDLIEQSHGLREWAEEGGGGGGARMR